MSDTLPEATISIPVDPYNPGEFFACCGLLELNHVLTVQGCRALGWFDKDEQPYRFSISAFENNRRISLDSVMSSLRQCRISTTHHTSKEGPVLLGDPFNIILDWRSPFPQNGSIKTFAGQQELYEIVQALQRAIQEIHEMDNGILKICNTTDKQVTAFGIEKAENVIDAGFSMDEQKGRLLRLTPVFLEFLALIGAQRFCPGKTSDMKRVYYTWHVPLTAPLAAISCSVPMSTIPQRGFVFQMYKRDHKGRYKGFAPARKYT